MSASLSQERQKLSFNKKDLSHYIYRNEEEYKKFTGYYRALAEDLDLRNDPNNMGKSRVELFKIAAKKGHRLQEKFNYGGDEEMINVLDHFDNALPATIHILMFIPCIELLGSEEQIKKYLEPSKRLEIIGAYAQSEMGHGSDIRGLETTATFDHATGEFIINTPTLTASKWWPAELGFAANHCICHAQLIIGEKNYGVHGFIIQIRDMETNTVLPGVKAGDIGPKYGFHSKDNGYLFFDNVRVPRDSLLGRYAEVTRDGKFKRKGNDKVGYAIMMKVRNCLSHQSWKSISKAATIGVRYSIVRTQFESEDGKERKVLDYQLQQDKIITNIALAYAMHAGAYKATEMIEENTRRVLANEDFSMMADIHATLAGTKSIYTGDALWALETIRMACGGHGYSSYSGFTNLIHSFNLNPTIEGENSVMTLQTARYLIKHLGLLAKGEKISEFVEYLEKLEKINSGEAKFKADTLEDVSTNEILEMMRANAAFAVLTAAMTLREGVKEVGPKEAWDKLAGSELVDAARAHVYYYTYKAFMDRTEREVKNPQVKSVLQNLCDLFAIDRIIRHPQNIFESGYLSPEQFKLLKKKKTQLLAVIRPDAIGLVDAFEYPDNTLNSALGTYDGNVYQNLWDWVQNYNDLNKADLSETYYKYIKGFRNIKAPKPRL